MPAATRTRKPDPAPAETNPTNVQPLREGVEEAPAPTKEAVKVVEPQPIKPEQAPAPAAAPEPTPEEAQSFRDKLIAKVPPVDQRPKSIYGMLAQIMGLIPRIEKRGRNDFHNYSYATESDIKDALGPLLSAYGILPMSTVVSLERMQRAARGGEAMQEAETLTRVTLSCWFVHGESAQETERTTWIGEGDDPMDKGGYKGITGGHKYWLLNAFLIATGSDPEADNATDRRAAAAEARTSVRVQPANNRPAPPRQQQRPQAQRPPAAEVEHQQGATQPAPGGRQAEANAPAGAVFGELIRTAGVRNSEAAAALITQLTGEAVTLNPEDKAGSFAAWLEARQKDGPEFGKLIFELRKHVNKLQQERAQQQVLGDGNTAAVGENGASAAPEDTTDYEAGDAL